MSRSTLTPFEQALLDASLEEFSDIPKSEEDIDVAFSPAFLKKSHQLLKKTNRKIWHYTNTAAKRAVVAAIIVAALTMTAMGISAVREAVIGFFMRDEGTHYGVSFDPEQAASTPERIETVYMPTYLPKGFYLDTAAIDVAGVTIIWMDGAGNLVVFTQLPIPDEPAGNWYGINAEGVVKETIQIGGYEVTCIHDEGRTYLWTDSEYFYNLYCDSTVSDEEMQKIFFSIQVDADAVIIGAE